MAVERFCECCNARFTAKAADVKRGWARFCSKRCKAIRQTYGEQRPAYRDDDEADQSWGEHEIYMEAR